MTAEAGFRFSILQAIARLLGCVASARHPATEPLVRLRSAECRALEHAPDRGESSHSGSAARVMRPEWFGTARTHGIRVSPYFIHHLD